MKKFLISLLVMVSYTIVTNAQITRDVLRLKNGSIIKGTITQQSEEGPVRIKITDGCEFVFAKEEISSLTKEAISQKAVSAQTNSSEIKGFRGFIEFGNAIDLYKYGIDGSIGNRSALSISTSLGYQSSPYIFVGAGLGFDYNYSLKTYRLPIFSDFRFYLMTGKVSPVLGLKFGYSPTEVKGFYFSPSIGLSILRNESYGINLSICYSLVHENKPIDIFTQLTDSEARTFNCLAFKVGLEF